MREFQRKQKNKRRLYSIPSLVVLCVVTFLLMRGALNVVEKERESNNRLKDSRIKMATLGMREQVLKENVIRLQTEEGIKDEIRERFNVTSEGEHIAVIIDDRSLSTSTNDTILPWYKRLWTAIIRGK